MKFLSSFSKTKVVFFSALLCLLNIGANAIPHHSDAALKAAVRENIKNDDLSGEDPAIRAAALKALGTAAGTVVVMNAQTGQIYSIVNQKWAVEEGFKPCSTIKLVTGAAGVREGLIRKNGNLSKGSYRLGLNDALAYSNNPYFQKVGRRMGSATMIRYARSLGLGKPTGINAPNEFAGKLPYGNENARIYSHADDFEVTPLQLAVMVSALTNGGKILVPRITSPEYAQANFRGAYRTFIDFPATDYERVIPGMVGAVKYGTARRVKDKTKSVAGKTGSCIFKKTWVGLFASVAPINDPRFAVVVITRGKYSRGKYSAAIAGSVYRTLNQRFSEPYDNNLARVSVPSVGKPRKTVIASAPPKPTYKKNPSVASKKIIKYRKVSSTRVSDLGQREVKRPKKKPVVYVDGKPEITRPRVVKNN